jgi:glucose 1-dehydrogenase
MTTMKAITVQPGTPGSLQLEEFRTPGPDRGAVLIRAVALGICGTDRDIIASKYGAAPPGHKRLIIGHESLGRVEQAPPDSGLSAGDLVVGIVRHPDPVPCSSCAVGEWDMCRNGQFTEHGIKAVDGFGSEFYRLDPQFVVPVDESLGLLGVLVEPMSVVVKAWEHIERIGNRARWRPARVLVTGGGPVGLLAALLGVGRGLDVHIVDHNTNGPKPVLARDLGATYHSSDIASRPADFDVILECTGSGAMALDVMRHAAPDGIVCLLGVTSPGDRQEIDAGALNLEIVSGNRVIFGSVNANRAHYDGAVAALQRADSAWLHRMITRRVPLSDWRSAFEKRPNDVKTILEFDTTALR